MKMFTKILLSLFLIGQIFTNFWIFQKIKELKTEKTFLQTRMENLISFKERENAFIQKYLPLFKEDFFDKTLAIRILKSIFEYSEKYQLPPELILSIIKIESNFNHKAFSNKGAIGLMQILPETGELVATYIGKPLYDLWKIEDNIEIGVAYLYLLQRYYSLDEAIRRYYAGKYYNTLQAQIYYQKVNLVLKELAKLDEFKKE